MGRCIIQCECGNGLSQTKRQGKQNKYAVLALVICIIADKWQINQTYIHTYSYTRTHIQNYDKYKHTHARTHATTYVYIYMWSGEQIASTSEWMVHHKWENHIIYICEYIYIPIYAYWCFFFSFDSSNVKESQSERTRARVKDIDSKCEKRREKKRIVRLHTIRR